MGIFQTKASLGGMQKTSKWGPIYCWGSSRGPLLDATFDNPQKLTCLGYPISSLIFLAFISVLAGTETNLWVGLECHTAINLYQNLTIIERAVVNTKYQARDEQTSLQSLLLPQINIFQVSSVLRSLSGIPPRIFRVNENTTGGKIHFYCCLK